VIAPSKSLEEKGFAIVARCLTKQMVNHLCVHLSDGQHSQRNLLDVPMVRQLAGSKAVKQTIDRLLGQESFAVRGILFNKTPDANWKVVWHQDRTIAVRERKNVAGFGPWSIKAGVQHVQPPASTSGILDVQDDRHPVALGRESGKQRSTARHPRLTPSWLSLK
jgi:hypothetical protein